MDLEEGGRKEQGGADKVIYNKEVINRMKRSEVFLYLIKETELHVI